MEQAVEASACRVDGMVVGVATVVPSGPLVRPHRGSDGVGAGD